MSAAPGFPPELWLAALDGRSLSASWFEYPPEFFGVTGAQRYVPADTPTQHLSVSDVRERIRTERDSYSAAPPSVGTEQALVVLNGLLAFIKKGGSNG